MEMHIPVSIGELIDKITILQIKASRFQGEALAHVQQELNLLEEVRLEAGISIPEGLESAIKAELWRIEDAIRERGGCKRFR